MQSIRIVEFSGIGPGPFAAMLLADLGADVVRVDRPGAPPPEPSQIAYRGRPSVALDLKTPSGVEAALRLVEQADALIEGYRPGVMERLGLGPEVCLARRPSLVYGRMTGWGQSGPLAHAAGHDINYIALTGALHAIGPAGGPPIVPLNLVGDYGGGAMFLAFGVVSALLEARRSGQGQVVDAAMLDGAAVLMGPAYGRFHASEWRDARGINLLDGGAHFYSVYETADGKWVAMGAIEPQFYAEMIEKLELDAQDFAPQNDPRAWPRLRAKLAERIKARTRDELDQLFAGSDACYAPVLSLGEAPLHPHNAARSVFVDVDGVVQPAPAPRFSRTIAAMPGAPQAADNDAILSRWGFTREEIVRLLQSR